MTEVQIDGNVITITLDPNSKITAALADASGEALQRRTLRVERSFQKLTTGLELYDFGTPKSLECIDDPKVFHARCHEGNAPEWVKIV